MSMSQVTHEEMEYQRFLSDEGECDRDDKLDEESTRGSNEAVGRGECKIILFNTQRKRRRKHI
jgi:hypothetical protein